MNLDQCNPKLRERILKHVHDEDRTKTAVQVDRARQGPELEPAAGGGPLPAIKDEGGATPKLHLKFVSFRKCLCDPDNISIKALLDALRYANIISGDEPEKISLEISQQKVHKGELERTEISVYET